MLYICSESRSGLVEAGKLKHRRIEDLIGQPMTDQDESDVAVIAADMKSVISFIAITATGMLAAGSILYSIGLAPLSSAQFERRLKEIVTTHRESAIELERHIDDKHQKTFATTKQFEELVAEDKRNDARLTELDQKVRVALEQRLNELWALISRIDERSKNTSDQINDIHRNMINREKPNGRP